MKKVQENQEGLDLMAKNQMLVYDDDVNILGKNVKGKVVPVLNKASRHEGVLGECRYSSTHSLTSALGGGVWSASRPGRFTSRERSPGTHWIGGWIDPRTVLDTVVKG
jgi:hypothetical protein